MFISHTLILNEIQITWVESGIWSTVAPANLAPRNTIHPPNSPNKFALFSSYFHSLEINWMSTSLNEDFTEWVLHWMSTSLIEYFTEWVLELMSTHWMRISLNEYFTDWVLHSMKTSLNGYLTNKHHFISHVARILLSFFTMTLHLTCLQWMQSAAKQRQN